ncbi:VQ motif-containing protein 10 [Mercurialis annua]|uniref:VQ motif-containing protein 10 n=1 Tax=Mercurialis annua TaxID=3986 RepID=UPI002160852D|nr:VQ motif-containing protein 10 [Mercurialis annua]
MASRGREDVKIVLIDTQYIVTDPSSFKSVVQNLTGKDCCVSWIDQETTFSGGKRKREVTECSNVGLGYSGSKCGSVGGGGGGERLQGNDWKLLSKGLSFKDLDRMILEMPPLEEWYQLLAPTNFF